MPEPVRLQLHPGQEAVWTGDARFRVIVAGRRWGKTQMSRCRLLAWALQHPGRRYWYIAPDRKMAKDIMWADLKAVLHPSWVQKVMETDLEVTLVSGSTIRLVGADEPDNLRGRKLGGVILDEYADMDPLTWAEVIRPSLADLQGPAWFIGTPKAFNHFYDLFTRGQRGDPDWQSWQFRSTDNPFLPAAEVEAARKDMDPKTFRQEWEASFEAPSGRVYYAFTRTRHVSPVTLDPALPVSLAFDFNLNPATCVIGQAHGPDVRVWREVRITHAGGEATRATAARAAAWLAEAGYRGEVRVYGDATGKAGKTTGPSDHAVLREVFPRCTWRIPAAQPHVRDRIAAVNSRCETATGQTHLTIDPACTGLIADLEQVTFADNGEIDKRSNPALTHLSDAFGYWVVRDWPVVTRGPVAAAAWVEALL
jgi:hypothetical protein